MPERQIQVLTVPDGVESLLKTSVHRCTAGERSHPPGAVSTNVLVDPLGCPSPAARATRALTMTIELETRSVWQPIVGNDTTPHR